MSVYDRENKAQRDVLSSSVAQTLKLCESHLKLLAILIDWLQAAISKYAFYASTSSRYS